MSAFSRRRASAVRSAVAPGLITALAALSACTPKPLLLTVTPSTAKVYGYNPRVDSTLPSQQGSASIIVKDEGTRVLITAGRGSGGREGRRALPGVGPHPAAVQGSHQRSAGAAALMAEGAATRHGKGW